VPRWADVTVAAPDLAERCVRRLLDPGLVLLGTLRANGSPRISPVEPLVVDGELELGMMPGSLKARDLLRDPRCVVHSIVVSKDGDEGDAKVYGCARDVRDADARERYGVALEAAIGWRPEGDFHLFAVDVDRSAGCGSRRGRRTSRAGAPRGASGAGSAAERRSPRLCLTIRRMGSRRWGASVVVGSGA